MSYLSHIQKHLVDRSFLRSLGIAFPLFIIALILNYIASTYAVTKESLPVTDIILSNTSVHDVDGVFMAGTIFLVISIAYLALERFNRIPFILESIALFVAVRSFFITFTHIAPFPTRVEFYSSIFARLNFGGDLFFSGHTGLPFLMALIFWQHTMLRYMFLALSVSLGVIVLLGHLHYTIDVLSAFFITYGIFHASLKFFKKEYALFITTH